MRKEIKNSREDMAELKCRTGIESVIHGDLTEIAMLKAQHFKIPDF
jgi:hypothetical protein